MQIRVAHMLNSMGMGGIENFLMNVYRNIDREKFQFDFILQSEEKSYFEDEITKLGGKIYKIPRVEKNPINHITELKNILKSNNYQVIHRHTANSISFIDLLVAKICKIPVRISHSHSTSHDSKVMNLMFKPFLYNIANCHLACGSAAGKWLYGNRKFEIINNGIDIERYQFKEEIRKKYREEFGIKENEILIGHVGRFNEPKNHKYLIKIFELLCKTNDNYKLLLCGDGNLRKEIEQQIKEYHLEDKIILTGVRNDINFILQAMDIFVFPSLYEGLGIVLIEAQMTNIPALVSDAIPREAIYNDNVKKLKIDEDDIKVWSDEIEKVELLASDRKFINTNLLNDYDDKIIAKRLCKIYKGE